MLQLQCYNLHLHVKTTTHTAQVTQAVKTKHKHR